MVLVWFCFLPETDIQHTNRRQFYDGSSFQPILAIIIKYYMRPMVMILWPDYGEILIDQSKRQYEM